MTRDFDEFPEVLGWHRKVSDLCDKGIEYTYDMGNGVYKTIYCRTSSKHDYNPYTEVVSYLQVLNDYVCKHDAFWMKGDDFYRFFLDVSLCLDARVARHVSRLRVAGYV